MEPEAPKPWYAQHALALITVVALVLGGIGYSISPEDQQVLAGAAGGLTALVTQIVGVVKNVLASKK